MTRPAPEQLNQTALGRTGKIMTINQAQSVWAVTYQGHLIAGHTRSQIDAGPKYFRTQFPGPGHAKNLARKLNRYFHSEDFVAVELIQKPV